MLSKPIYLCHLPHDMETVTPAHSLTTGYLQVPQYGNDFPSIKNRRVDNSQKLKVLVKFRLALLETPMWIGFALFSALEESLDQSPRAAERADADSWVERLRLGGKPALRIL